MGMIYLLALNRHKGSPHPELCGAPVQNYSLHAPASSPESVAQGILLESRPVPSLTQGQGRGHPATRGHGALARGSIPAGIQLKQGQVQPFTMEKLLRLVFQKLLIFFIIIVEKKIFFPFFISSFWKNLSILGKAFIIFCDPQVCCGGNKSSATSVRLHHFKEIFGSDCFSLLSRFTIYYMSWS